MADKPPIGRPACRATKRNGDPCANRAAAGSAYCGAHGGGKRRVGVPSKIDEALVNQLVEVVERGVTWEVAAQAAGISKTTLHAWRERGADDLEAGRPTLFADLADRLTRATAAAEVELVRVIRAHGPVDWRSAAWILERRAPERWARRDKLDVDVHERAAPRTVTPAEPARRETIIELLAAATKPPAGLDNDGTGEHP